MKTFKLVLLCLINIIYNNSLRINSNQNPQNNKDKGNNNRNQNEDMNKKGEFCDKGREEMINERRNDIISNSKDNKLYNGEDYIIQIFNTTPIGINEAVNQQSNISILNLGECRIYLESLYGSPLIIYKMDLERKNGITNQIEYSVYTIDGNEISLSQCSNFSLTTANPINIRNSKLNTIRINTTFKEGYDMFNADDKFYTDLCTPYTNEDGIDVPMSKRKSDYYENIDFCEEGCNYVSFNSDYYRVNCSCPIKTSMSSTNNSSFSVNIINVDSDFYKVFDNTNIQVIKCFKLVFSYNGFSFNWGSYFAIFIIIIQISLIISYFIIQLKPLEKKIEKLTRNTMSNIQNQSLKSINLENNDNSPRSNKNLKENINDKSSNQIKSIEDIMSEKSKKIPLSNPMKILNNRINKTNELIESKEKSNKQNYKNNKETFISNASTNYQNNILNSGKNTINRYTNEELNILNFYEAYKNDNRKFWEYYCSILRYKQLIIFTFFNYSDYNHEIIKFSLFFWSILLYTTFNALFFVDSSMNKIYEEKGSLQFISALPKTIFSTLCCCLINFLLKLLTLSQRDIQKIKDEKEIFKQKEKADLFEKCFKIKVIIFFIIIFLLLIIFWYYLSAFCAVYKNTQKHLFKDTAMSFAINMIYPFFICFFASVFRFWSFKKKNKCLYEISRFIQIF